MNAHAIGSIAVAAVLLAGCCLAPRGEGGSAGDRVTAAICKEKECKVAVRVAACTITVDPEWLGVARGNRDVAIVWEIRNSPGVTFAKEGPIFFKERDREPAARQFSKPQPMGDTTYRWTMANNSPGVFHYGIRVVDNGRACPPLDPTIVADM